MKVKMQLSKVLKNNIVNIDACENIKRSGKFVFNNPFPILMDLKLLQIKHLHNFEFTTYIMLLNFMIQPKGLLFSCGSYNNRLHTKYSDSSRGSAQKLRAR